MKQFWLLLRLFRTLSERRELTGQLGFDRGALMAAGGLYLSLGAVFSLAVFIHPPARVYAGGSLAITTLFLIPVLLSDAADAFMNPAEVFVLAHRPIRAGSYIAAKAASIVNTAARIALPLNAVPAIAGLALSGTRWWYPLTHLAAVFFCSVFTAFATCGFFGALFQWVPVARLRSAALWAQIVGGLVFSVGPQLLRFVPRGLDPHGPYWSVVPMVWFARLSLAGQPAAFHLSAAAALPALVLSAALLAYGVRGLSYRYMQRVVMMMRAKSRSTTTRRRAQWLGDLIRRLTGHPSGRAAFGFLLRMMARDWTFRRFYLQSAVSLVVIVAISVSRPGGLASPFGRSQFVAAHVLPHVLGFALLGMCTMMTDTSQHRAAWIFLMVPMSGLRAFVRGVFWSLWFPAIATTHVVVLGVTTWLWGWRDAATFVTFSAAMASAELVVAMTLLGGLPFASPPRSTASSATAPVMMAFMFVAGALSAFQSFVLFHRYEWVIAAALVTAAFAVWIAPVAFHIVERNIALNLDRLTTGPQRMFQTLDDVSVEA